MCCKLVEYLNHSSIRYLYTTLVLLKYNIYLFCLRYDLLCCILTFLILLERQFPTKYRKRKQWKYVHVLLIKKVNSGPFISHLGINMGKVDHCRY